MTKTSIKYFDRIKNIFKKTTKSESSGIPLPPVEEQKRAGPFIGNDYIAFGKKQKDILLRLGVIDSSFKILEPGCGNARVSRHLLGEIDDTKGGELHGFDICQQSVEWASDNITKIAPHFIYKHLPNDRLDASVVFPYDDNYFDFCFSRSLFTHLNRDTTEAYIREISRVCKDGAFVYTTFFCFPANLDKDTFSSWKSKSDFLSQMRPLQSDGVSYANHAMKTFIIDHGWLTETIKDAGFEIIKSPLSRWFDESTGAQIVGSDSQVGWIFEKKKDKVS